ncbi:MAG: WD40 repeat domain-containing protein [Pseudomonadota bacterium]
MRKKSTRDLELCWQSSVDELAPKDGETHRAPVRCVALGGRDGKDFVVSGSDDRTLRLWDAATGEPLIERRISGRRAFVWVETFHMDGKPYVIAGHLYGNEVWYGPGRGRLRIWDAMSGRPLSGLFGDTDGSCENLSLGRFQGKPVVIAKRDNSESSMYDMPQSIRIYDLQEALTNANCQCAGHSRYTTPRVSAIACGSVEDAEILAYGDNDGTVTLHDLESDQRAKVLAKKGAAAVAMYLRWATVRGEPVLSVGYDDGKVQLWRLRSGRRWGKPVRAASGDDWITAASCGEIGDVPVIVTGNSAGQVIVWDVPGNTPLASRRMGGKINQISEIRDRRVAIAHAGGVGVLDLERKKLAK